MADIELNAYIAEIETLLEAEKNDEAVSHCRHILDYYPRNLAVYRLLGKGLLELGRLEDASDILYRVLSAAPDDFVAHVGMAIIGEEEGDLDKAIGHMERASEAQSNNTAIHSELKRLYGRRDGVEPAKIRLTRGALARLYLRGGNYSQAADELHAALQSAPDRLDWQILLAQVLWRDEQRIDAVEACQTVLDKLPDCVQANRILYEIWHSAGREDEATMFWGRVESLDPYLAHEIRDPSASPSFQLPRLDYVAPTPDEVMGVPDWVRDLGLGEDQLPSEVDDLGFSDRMTSMDSEQSTDLDDDAVLPDWLRDMASTEEEAPFLGQAMEGFENDEELSQDQDSGPQKAEEPQIIFEDLGKSTSKGVDQDEDLPDWLAEAVEWGDEQSDLITQEGETAGESDWLSEFSEESQGLTDSTRESEPLPDWMHEIASDDDSTAEDTLIAGRPAELPAASERSEDLPDWLLADQEEEQPAEPDDSLVDAAPGDVSETGEELPDWLAVIQEEDGPSDEIISVAEPSEEMDDDLPDWLTAIQDEETPEPIDHENLTADLGGEAVDQPPFDLKGEATAVSKDGEPFAVSDEVDIPSTPEDSEESVMVPSDKEPGTPDDAQDADDLESLLSDPDDALAWLEQLAAAEGTPLEELPSLQDEAKPEPEQAGVLPDPVMAADDETMILSPESTDQPGIEVLPEMEPASPEAMDELPDWLRELEPSPGEPPPPIVPGTEVEPDQAAIPDWLKDELLGEGETAELGAELAALGADVSEMPSEPDEAAAWLEQLAAAQEDYAPVESALGLDEPELPDWLAEEPSEDTPETEMSTVVQEAAQPPTEMAASADLSPSDMDEMGEMPEDVDEAMAWLEQLAAAEGAPLEELPSVTSADSTEPQLPSWLDAELHPDETETTLLSDETLAQLEEEAPGEKLAPVLDEPELPEWLQETLGAHDETVVAESADLEEPEPPEWLRESVDEADVGTTGEEPVLADEPQLPDWLGEPEVVEKAGADLVVDQAVLEEPELPEWLREPEAVEELGEADVTETATLEEPELPEWLREPDLLEEPGTADVTEPTILEEPELPEWLREPDEALDEVDEAEPVAALEEPELPDWLHEQVQASETTEVEPAVVLDEPELPEWLRESEIPGGEKSEPVAAEPAAAIEEPDLPEWLREPVEALAKELEPQEEETVPAAVQEVEPLAEPDEPELAEVLETEPIIEAPKVPADVFSLRHQVDAEPQDHVLRLTLARALRDDGMTEEALTEYDELVSSSQELDDVAVDLEQILDSDPGHTQTQRILGDLYVRQNRLAEALNAYRKALGNL